MNQTEERKVRFRYFNHRGETADRIVTPISLEFRTSEAHPLQPAQWILLAYCHVRKAERDFATRHILSAWEPYPVTRPLVHP